MNTFYKILGLSLILVGCASTHYSLQQIGYDKYSVVASGQSHGIAEYSTMMQQAYNVCRAAGYKDYVMLSERSDQQNVMLIFQCLKDSIPNPATSNTNSTSSYFDKFYDTARRKVNDMMNEFDKQ